MSDRDKYLTPDDFKRKGKKPRKIRGCISAIKKEMVDGRPHLVIYMTGVEKGYLLTRKVAEQLTAAFGPNPMVEEFFASPDGQLH